MILCVEIVQVGEYSAQIEGQFGMLINRNFAHKQSAGIQCHVLFCLS
jgi:hypothetical protein